MQAYSDPSREADPFALPDVEIWEVTGEEQAHDPELETGFYWRACFPGCLPDGEPQGPCATYVDALAAAQEEE